MGAKKFHIVRVSDDYIFCTDGNWYPQDEVGFIHNRIPRRYASGGGAAGKLRSLPFAANAVEAK